MRTVVTLTSLLLLAGTAQAHIAMTKPVPRSLDQKAGPCGSTTSVRGSNVTTYAPGETITVEWDETVDHPGHYRVAFDDDGVDAFANPNNPNDNFPSTLVEPIADKVGGHYTQEVTLPMTPCTNCTLQLMQVMTTTVPYNSFYYQCADIVITGEGSGSGSGSGSGDADEVEGGCSTGSGSGGVLLLLGLAALIGPLRGRSSRSRHGG
ncbi:MAG: lytic polysaccharide monooxygenase [Deltaproteobacteria bacterium]|nr:lytic polysaccharide monooxygenase [Deltaproteobacteria bacterium]